MVPARSGLRFSRIVANDQKARATNCATFGNSVPVKFSLSAGASALSERFFLADATYFSVFLMFASAGGLVVGGDC